MSKLIQSLKAKMLQSTKLLQQLASDRSRNAARSPDTEHDYLRLGQSLLRRAKAAQDGLIGVVCDTRRPSTFQKRMSALRFTLQQRQLELLGSIIEPVSDDQAQRHIAAFDEQIACVQALLELRRRGLGGLRALRNSKRRALSGLPHDWRVQLCKRGRAGRYGAALLVAALTGCRPSELERGVKVWQTQDAATQAIEIHFEVAGAKVKREQGQPHRRLTYAAGDTHPLLSMIKALLPGTAETPVVVQVASAMNFSAEVQRLARIFHAPLISGRSAAQMCAGLLQRPRLRLQPGLVSPTAGLLRVAAPTPAWVAGHFCVLAPARRYLPVKVSATGSWREQRSARSASWRPGTGGCAGYCASPRRRP